MAAGALLVAALALAVDLVFALLAPDTPGVEHLKALALVSRTLRDGDMRSKLRANDDPVALRDDPPGTVSPLYLLPGVRVKAAARGL